MALTIHRTMTLSGVSKIDDQDVVSFYATIPLDASDGDSTTVSKTIINQSLYSTNRSAARADEALFQEKVYEVEDFFSESGSED
jgi:hypothetical protein